MSVKLSEADIDYIIDEVTATDGADPFGDYEYMLEFVQARVLDALPRRLSPTSEELRKAADKVLEYHALRLASNSLEFETMTGLHWYIEDTLTRLMGECRAELTGNEYRPGFRYANARP